MKTSFKSTLDAHELFRRGTLALSDVETAGMRIDLNYVEKATADITITEAQLAKELKDDKTWRIWQRRFGSSAYLGSRDQLAAVLYQDLGYKPSKVLENDWDDEVRGSTDKEAFADIDLPFVKTYTRMQGLHTAKKSWLTAILREQQDGYLHPSYTLNIAVSYRSSSFDPNVQNWPTRNPEQKKIVRQSIIPRKGHCIEEDDFKGIEVSTGACYHQDKKMLKYLRGEGDMHRDTAMETYLIEHDWQVSDDIRYSAKNRFVFPAFYGSYYLNMAGPLWRAMDQMKLRLCKFNSEEEKKNPTGRLLSKHLASKGLAELGNCDPEQDAVEGTFEYHLQQVFNHFWEVRFKGYSAWKEEWYAQYLRKAGFMSKTGFAYNGYFKKNAVINYPIQGSAFHCLLWSLTRVNSILKKRKMKSVIIGQIHDSMIGDVHRKEIDDYHEIVDRVTRVELPRHWGWLNAAPLSTDREQTEIDQSWYFKKKVA